MKRVKICLAGPGNVGKHFVKLLIERNELFKKQYGIDLQLFAVAGSKGGVISSSPLDLEKVYHYERQEPWKDYFPGNGIDDLKSWQIISKAETDLLVEATPSDLKTGEPGLMNFKAAIKAGINIVTLAKGALVTDFAGLMKSATEQNLAIKFAGATAAALPTVDVAHYCLAGATIKKISGILNGTTNYILTKMARENVDFNTALKEAQEMGVAEPKPDQDIEGWDTAAKIVIITNAIFGSELSLKDISVAGIKEVTLERIAEASLKGKTIRLVGESGLDNNGCKQAKQDIKNKVFVKPLALENHHTLARVDGTTKAIHFETDIFGDLTVVGGKSDPRAAAAAAIKDIINLAREGFY